MNLNPFKNTYKIVEHSNFGGDKKYKISYGNIFGRVYLETDGGEWLCEENGGSFSSLDTVKTAIQIHAEKLLKKKMQKFSKKTLGYI